MKKIPKRAIAAAIIIALSQFLPASVSVRAQPDRVLVGAYDQHNGVVFVANDLNLFGLRLLVYRPGATVEDSMRPFEFGYHAPDGSYAELSLRSRFDDKIPVALQWSRISDRVIVGRISAPAGTRVAIEAYRPWSDLRGDASWAAFTVQDDRRTIFGEQVHSQKEKPPLRNFLVRADRVANGAADYSDAQAMRRTLAREGHAQQSSGRQEDREVSRFAALSFESSPTSSFNSVGFVAMVGDDFKAMETEAEKVLARPVAEILDQAEKNYETVGASSNGALGDSFEILSRTLNWSRSYLPEKNTSYIAINREAGRNLRKYSLSWDLMFTTAIGSMFDGATAASTMKLLLEGQTADGRVPLRRYLQNSRRDEASVTAGRSMPPVGALCAWKIYMTTNDLGFLGWAYPRLRQWNDWWFTNRGDGQAWRDGNGDGLLEWGFDAELEHGQLGARAMSNPAKQKLAFSESGLDDRPQWLNGQSISADTTDSNQPQSDEAKYNDGAHTLEYSAVGLNALYALDTEILLMMARELGLPLEQDKLQFRYEQIRKLVNEKLWSEEDGLYLNRHWDGRFSRRLSPENFYPLIAGLADEERARRMMTTLRDPKKFWGAQLLPSISRDDAAFAERAVGRGAIWAPMNYLAYLGLKRYGYYNETAELARKSLLLARSALEKGGKFYDQYSSGDGRPVGEKGDEEGEAQKSYFFGLMIWPAVEELISADLWAGLSFGSPVAAEESRVERVSFSGVKFDVILGPKRTVIRRDGNIEVECESPARLRAYRSNHRAIGFALEAKERTHILVPASEGRKITVSVDNKVLGSTSVGAAASFKVSGGVHKILIVK
jgi:hypothetical protein